MRIKTLLLLLLAVSADAQNGLFFPKPEAGSVTVRKNLEYKPGQKYDLHRPAGDAVVPVVIFANVGASPYQNWGGYIGWAEATANAGMAAVLYEGLQGTAIAEFDALMADLRKRADDLKIDPSRVSIWSGSSNVLIGLPIAMDRRRDYIRSAVVYYGAAEATELRTDLPVLFIRAGLDTAGLNRNIDALLVRALAANAPWTIENYGGGLHAFDIRNDTEITRILIHRTLSFIKLNMRPEVSTAYVAAASDAALGSAYARGEWVTAIEGYRARVAADSSDAASILRLGTALLGHGDYDEALKVLEKAWNMGNRGPRDVALPASQAAARIGNLPRALHWLDIILSSRFGPPIPEVRASEDYARIRNEPAFAALLDGLEQQQAVVAKLESPEPADGLKTLRDAKNGRLTQEPVLLGIAYRLLAGGRKTAAIEVFRIASGRYPASANAWESLSEAYEANGDRTQAVEASRKAIALLPRDRSLDAARHESVRKGAAERIERLSGRG